MEQVGIEIGIPSI